MAGDAVRARGLLAKLVDRQVGSLAVLAGSGSRTGWAWPRSIGNGRLWERWRSLVSAKLRGVADPVSGINVWVTGCRMFAFRSGYD